MRNFKKYMCLILSLTMILVLTPADLAAAEIIGDADEVCLGGDKIALIDENLGEVDIDEAEDLTVGGDEALEESTIKESEAESAADESAEEVNDETVDETIAESVDETIVDSVDETIAESLDEAIDAERVDGSDILGSEIAGVDYEEDMVYAIVDTEEEAEDIADYYNIILESYDYKVAYYELPQGVSVAEVVQKSANNEEGYPALYPNHFGTVSDMILQDADISEDNTDDLEIESYITDSELLKNKNLLNENVLYTYPISGYQWQHDVIGSPYAWTSGIKGNGIKVAILSTGIINADVYITPTGSRTKILGSYYAPEGSTDPTKCTETYAGNGTFLAEIIGEEIASNGSDTYAGVGVAPECSLYNIKITVGEETKVDEINLIKGINYASEQHVDVMVIDAALNLPITGSYNDGVEWTIGRALGLAHSNGIAIFAPTASGSDQSEAWPAACENVIAVTATDKNNQRLAGSGYSSNTDFAAPGDNVTTARLRGTGSLGAVGIAAGEAALILSQKSSLKALWDDSGSPLTGSALVTALEKHMKASAISAGKECGAGIVYLPKALSLGTITTKPTAPTIKTYGEIYHGVSDLGYQFGIEDNYYGISVYYTTNGKTPSYKNGAIDSYSKKYDLAQSSIEEPVDISQKDFVIKAIAVDEKHGLVSPVVTKTIPLDYIYDLVVTAPTNKLVRGKSLKCTATVVPNNKYTSGVTWHVGWVNPLDPTDIREQLAKDNKVTVNSSGTVSAGKMEVNLIQQNYKVWAQSKKDSSKIGQWYFTVAYACPYKSLSVDKTDRTRTAIFPETSPNPMTDWNTDKNLLMNVLTKDINGIESQAYNEPEDFIVTSSNPDVVSVTHGRDSRGKNQWFREIKGPGKATITITDTMCQGLKTTYTINVVQYATGVNLNGGSYVVAGKTLTLTASPIPTNTSISNVKWELYDNAKNPITNDKRIKISNGKIITTKDAPAGTYYVMARATNLESRIVAWMGGDLDNAWVINVAPADKLVKKLEVDSEYKNCTIFTDKNAFGSATEKTVYCKITGGDRDNQLKLYPAHFEITSSNTAIVTTTSATVYNRDYLKFTLKAKGPAGKATITVKALDGSNAKVSFTVNAVNPVSAIRIAPSKAGTQMAVLQGKSIKLKPVIVEEYGKVSNKNVTWSLKEPTDERYVTINSKTGDIKTKTDVGSTFSNPYRIITVKATAAGGSGAVGESDVRLYTDYGKMQFCDASASPVDSAGKAIKGSGTIHNNYGQARGVFSDIDFYVRIKPKNTSKDKWDDFITVSSSNPSLAVVNKVEKVDDKYYPTGSPENLYYVYHFKGRCVTGTGDNKTGTVKFTITGADGSQKLTYTLKVTK